VERIRSADERKNARGRADASWRSTTVRLRRRPTGAPTAAGPDREKGKKAELPTSRSRLRVPVANDMTESAAAARQQRPDRMPARPPRTRSAGHRKFRLPGARSAETHQGGQGKSWPARCGDGRDAALTAWSEVLAPAFKAPVRRRHLRQRRASAPPACAPISQSRCTRPRVENMEVGEVLRGILAQGQRDLRTRQENHPGGPPRRKPSPWK